MDYSLFKIIELCTFIDGEMKSVTTWIGCYDYTKWGDHANVGVILKDKYEYYRI